MTFEEIRKTEHDSMMPTYGRFPVALVSGKGAVALDTEGKTYIDFTSGIGVNSLGYSDPAWAAAVARQAGTLQHISNLYYSPVQTELARRMQLEGVDTTREALGKIERGKQHISASQLRAIRDILSTTYDELLKKTP